MVAVPSVQMAVVQIVDVVAMGYWGVTAVGSVLMGVFGVFDTCIGRTFVPVIVVLVMAMAVVDVVHVIVVHHGHVTAIGSVNMRMIVMPVRIAHEHSLASTTDWVWNGGMTSLADRLLDASILGGFSRVGYAVRSRASSWESIPKGALVGRRIVVTGPTSGIGRAAAGQLASLGARLVLVGRDEQRTRSVADELANELVGEHDVVACDMADLDQVSAACDHILVSGDDSGAPDAVVHNAGALLHERILTPQGFETTFAVHVLAPHLMTRRLAAPRCVWVTSGGMYGASLVDPERRDPMAPSSYDGTKQYASAKRMQVALVEEWAARDRSRWIAAMHPGWADTPGVRSSLPGFARLTRPILRTPDQGADTITWMCATGSDLASGEFWCDREVRPRHRLPATKRSDTPERRAAAMRWADSLTDPWT